MDKQKALELAINALQKEYRYFLYASDSDWADKRRIEISKTIEIIESMLNVSHVLPPVDPNLIKYDPTSRRGLFEYLLAKIKGED